MPQEPQPPSEDSGITLEIPEGVDEYYANFVQILSSQWDFAIMFGTTPLPSILERGPEASTWTSSRPLQVEVVVRMSPQHAKATAAVLSKLVTEYEGKYGPIGGGVGQTR